MKVRNNADLIAAHHGGPYVTVIPVSCDIGKDHRALMGTGLGKRAAAIWPELSASLGRFLEVGGAHVYVMPVTRQPNAWTVCVPVRFTFSQKPDMRLIEAGVEELVALANIYPWEKVFLPRLGCGPGGLDWEETVRPLYKLILDDRFVVVHMDEPEPPKAARKPAVRVGAVSKAAQKRMAKKKED